jgi:hypothetical protein
MVNPDGLDAARYSIVDEVLENGQVCHRFNRSVHPGRLMTQTV